MGFERVIGGFPAVKCQLNTSQVPHNKGKTMSISPTDVQCLEGTKKRPVWLTLGTGIPDVWVCMRSLCTSYRLQYELYYSHNIDY